MHAAIFDLDGTLADSAPDIAAALNGAFVDAGFAPFDLMTVKSMVGAGARLLVQRGLIARMAAPQAADVDRLHAALSTITKRNRVSQRSSILGH